MEIHITKDGQQYGPYTLEEVNAQLAGGGLSPDDLAWHEGAPGWIMLSAVEGVVARAPERQPPPAPKLSLARKTPDTNLAAPPTPPPRRAAAAASPDAPSDPCVWHYTDGGSSRGPIAESFLRGLHRRGIIANDTFIWQKGQDEWQPYGDIFGKRTDDGYARERVAGPALFMMIYAIFNIVVSLGVFFFEIEPYHFLAKWISKDTIKQVHESMSSCISPFIQLIFSVVIFIGGYRMKELKSYTLASNAISLTIFCTQGGCCLIGLVGGIWAMVVLSDPKVKSAFFDPHP